MVKVASEMIVCNAQPNFESNWIDLLKLDPVHPVDEKKTLLRRFDHDRLIYVLLADNNPVAMLQVALTEKCPVSVKELWDQKIDEDFNFAVFYSVFRIPTSTQGSVRDLIYGAATDLQKRYPGISKFITLSPIPTLRKTFKKNPSIETITEFIEAKKDPVARFHMMNGAIPWAYRPKADFSKLRRNESYGWMVSYDYTPLLQSKEITVTLDPILQTI